jgi:hypothetical protein
MGVTMMVKKSAQKWIPLITLTILLLVSLACGTSANGEIPTSNPDLLQTIIVATASAAEQQTLTASTTNIPEQTNTPQPSPTVTPAPQVLIEDGIYIVGNSNAYEKISAVDDDSVFNFPAIPTASNNKPVFAIKGDKFPIGDIELYGYYAGIGVDTELVSLGSGKLAAKINQVFENSPAKEAGLGTGEIIFGVNGEAFQAIQLNFGFPPYRDLVGILNPNQSEITIDVLSGTTERAVTLSRTYRLSGNNFKTNNPISSVTVEPNGDYVLLKVTWALESGIYRIEFKQNKTQKWIFVVP